MEINEYESIHFTDDMILNFLDYLKESDRSDATIQKYAAELKSFYKFLPPEKLLTSDSLSNWRAYQISSDFAPRTINTRIAACNSFLGYLNRAQWQVPAIPLIDESSVSPLSREEYYNLLRAARRDNKEWLYFLIKTFCCLGLSPAELPLFTVDALVAGNITIVTKSRTRNVFIPKILQQEFLDYALRNNINSGCLFKSPSGIPLNRSYIISELQVLCESAGISKEKGSPKFLQDLYIRIHSDIRASYPSLINKEYSRLLEEEDSLTSWDTVAV